MHGVVSLKSYFIIDLTKFSHYRLISLQIGSGIGTLGPWELQYIDRNRSLVIPLSPTDFFLLTYLIFWKIIFSAVDHTSDEVFIQELTKLVLREMC